MKILDTFEQGSLEWAQQRCGRITMSNAKALLTKGKGVTKQNYILDVVAERLSGEPIEGYYGIDMERGNFLEEWALKAFQQVTNTEGRAVGFVLQDDERIGCSPDWLIEKGDNAGLEIKCPKPRQHIQNIYKNGIDDYRPQAQGGMWVCEKPFWYIVSFCPWVKQYPLYIKRIARDQNIIDQLAASAVAAADMVDDLAAKAAEAKTTALIADLAAQARDAWDNVLADNVEVHI